MGLLDSVLGGSRASGGMSPITMALLGVLAYRTFQGKGRLADMLGQYHCAGHELHRQYCLHPTDRASGLASGDPGLHG